MQQSTPFRGVAVLVAAFAFLFCTFPRAASLPKRGSASGRSGNEFGLCSTYNSTDSFTGDMECQPSTPFCAVNRNTGQIDGCKGAVDCPDNVKGYDLVCHPAKPFCCCKDTQDQDIICNDIHNEYFDYVKQQACTLKELKHIRACTTPGSNPPKNRTRPSSTPRPTSAPMALHCEDHCMKNARSGTQGPYKARGCPEGCESHCSDGKNMDCGHELASKSKSQRGGDHAAKKDEGLSTGAIVGIACGVSAVAAAGGALVYFLVIKGGAKAAETGAGASSAAAEPVETEPHTAEGQAEAEP